VWFCGFLCTLGYSAFGFSASALFIPVVGEFFDVCGYLPLSHSSFTFISSILVCVMSLWEAKKSTTSRFSFLMGTMSNKHQNGAPAMSFRFNHQRIRHRKWISTASRIRHVACGRLAQYLALHCAILICFLHNWNPINDGKPQLWWQTEKNQISSWALAQF